MADVYAKPAVENTVDAASKKLLREANLAFISGSIAGAKTNDTAKRTNIKDGVQRERRYRPP